MYEGNILGLVRNHVPTISAGILSADLMNLESQLSLLQQVGIQLIHFDVMDGNFVPMFTVGPPFIKKIKTSLIKDVHLMINDPLDKVKDYVDAGADMVTVHVESCQDMRPVLRLLGELENKNDANRGLVRGIAINPSTPALKLEPLLDMVEMVVVLAVDPSDLGKGFIDSTKQKFQEIKCMVRNINKDILLTLDGGIKKDNINEVTMMGADIVVSGSALFKNSAVIDNTGFMLKTLRT